jgi:transcriptional regulator with XRE-family HTH domain
MPSRSPQASAPQRALALAIRELRLRQNLTQEQVALEGGWHPSEISSIESGRRNPTYGALVRISRGLGLRLSEVVARAEEIERQEAAGERR